VAATKAQVKAIVSAAMVAAGFRARNPAKPELNMPHVHSDCIIDGLYDATIYSHYNDFYDPTSGVPIRPELGDTYISTVTATGWTKDHIYSWNGATWDASAPREGMLVWIDHDDEFYKYNGTAWSKFTADVGTHYHTSIVRPGTTIPAFFIDGDGGFVFVAADGAYWKFLFSNTSFKKFKWSGSEWEDLKDH
jgi:hypothetical protein